MVLAGGFGKRIKSVWDAPKGLIPIWEKTILWYSLKEIEEIGVYKRIVLVTNEAHKRLYREFLSKSGLKLEVEVVSDGAGECGAARGAIVDLQLGLARCEAGGVLVLPCDTVTKGVFKFGDFVEFGKQQVSGLTVLARRVEKTQIVGKFGNLKVNSVGKLIEFVEKPAVAISSLAAAAIYYYPEKTRGWVEEYLADGGNPESPGMIIPWLLHKRRDVYVYYVYEVKGKIVDVGRLEELDWVRQQKC